MSKIVDAVKNNLDITHNKTLKDAVYEAFRKTIILGDIPAGERINELEFAELLNISRTPIRYALDKLAQEQLVNHVPGVGMIVKGINIKDAYEIYDIRLALDNLATLRAMEKMDEEDFDDLQVILEIGEARLAAGEIDLLLDSFSDFNEFIYAKAQMPRLRSILTELKAYLNYFRDVSIRSSERREVALKEHWLIFRGMKNRDIDQVRMLTNEHLKHWLTFILKEMERRHLD